MNRVTESQVIEAAGDTMYCQLGLGLASFLALVPVVIFASHGFRTVGAWVITVLVCIVFSFFWVRLKRNEEIAREYERQQAEDLHIMLVTADII